VPTLILHGDEDALVPIALTSLRAAKLIRAARLEVYKGAPHGICTTHKDRVNADLLEHLKV
jgi:non-heme chloroperoxidase